MNSTPAASMARATRARVPEREGGTPFTSSKRLIVAQLTPDKVASSREEIPNNPRAALI